MKAQLVGREEKAGDYGPYWVTKWTLEDGKKRTLSTFAPFARDLTLDAWYELETKTNDKGFTNLTGAKAIETPAPASTVPQSNGSRSWAPDGERENRIIRGNAANAAAALLAPSLALETEPEEAARKLIAAARVIELYLRDELQPEAPETKPAPQSSASTDKPYQRLSAAVKESGYPGGLQAFLMAEAPDLITDSGAYAARLVTTERADELITLVNELMRVVNSGEAEDDPATPEWKPGDELPFE